jgi:hypothetical protein
MRRYEWAFAAALLSATTCPGVDAALAQMDPNTTPAAQRPVPNAPGGSGVGVPGGSMSKPGAHQQATPNGDADRHPDGSVGNPSGYRENEPAQQRPVANAPAGGGVGVPEGAKDTGKPEHPEGSVGNPSSYGSEGR